MPEAKRETWSFDHLYKALFVEKKCRQCSWLTLSWKFGLDPMLQRNWTTSTCPYRAATWSAVSPDCNHRRTWQSNSLCHTMIHTACTLCAAWMPWILHGILLPLPCPATQLHQQSLLAGCTWQTQHHLAGMLFLQGFIFPELIFPLYLFQITDTMGFLSNMRRELCVQLLKHMSHFYS